MGKIVTVLSLLLILSVNVFADPIPLFNTGVDNSGIVLPVGSLEQHYIMTGPDPTSYTISNVLYMGTTEYPNTWIPPVPKTSWIGPINGNNWEALLGDYYYRLAFYIDPVLDHTKAKIQGKWASDNIGELYLNGNYTGITTQGKEFLAISFFTLDSGFVSGNNNFTFKVSNVDTPEFPNRTSPTGLMVSLNGQAPRVTVPEPDMYVYTMFSILLFLTFLWIADGVYWKKK